MTHRLGRRAALGAAARRCRCPPALAQPASPTGPIRMLVPWLPGGSSDTHLRVLSEIAGRKLGQPVIIENKPGASGTLGALAMSQEAKADGHMLGQMPITVFRLPAMTRRPTFDPMTDFSYVLHLTGYVFGVVVRADQPWQTWAESHRLRQGQSRQGHLRHPRRRQHPAHHHGTHRRAARASNGCTCPSAAAPTTSRRCCRARPW